MNRKLMAGLLTGIAAGSLIAVLFATKKGRRIRKQWIKDGSSLASDLKSRFNDFIDEASHRMHQYRKS